MFASLFFLAAAQGIVVPFGNPRQIERPRAPIETSGPQWAAQCRGSDDGNKAAPPVRIHGNTYLVGSCGISAIFIAGSQGHVLIDGGTEEDADLIADNIRTLGYRVEDVRFILTSHEHPDHIGGIAKLQRLSGATLVTSAAASRVFKSGLAGADDPQAGTLKPISTAAVGRIVADNEEVLVGNIMLTAIATPGHAPGALSWRWVSCDGGVCRTIVYADSLTAVSAPNYRFSDHPSYLAAFRASIARIAASPCEILLTPQPGASDMPHRLALGKPLFDPDSCKKYAAARTKQLDDRVAKEAGTPQPPRP